jgi:large subunit ribosomal protein L5
MTYLPSLKKKYNDEVIPALKKEFNYKSVMQVPRITKIVINQGVGAAVADKKLVEIAQAELTAIAGQKAVQTLQGKIFPISN